MGLFLILEKRFKLVRVVQDRLIERLLEFGMVSVLVAPFLEFSAFTIMFLQEWTLMEFMLVLTWPIPIYVQSACMAIFASVLTIQLLTFVIIAILTQYVIIKWLKFRNTRYYISFSNAVCLRRSRNNQIACIPGQPLAVTTQMRD